MDFTTFIIFLFVSYFIYTCLLSLATVILLGSSTFKQLFLENKINYISEFERESVNKYLNLVASLYLFTVAFSTPLFVLYCIIAVLTFGFGVQLILSFILTVLLSLIYILLFVISQGTTFSTRFNILSRLKQIESISVNKKELFILILLGCIYTVITLYIYISTIGLMIFPFV